MKQLIQIIGPNDCGKTQLIRSFEKEIIYSDIILFNTWTHYLDVPGKPIYLFQEVRKEHFSKLIQLVTSEFITINEPCKEPKIITNNGIWIYEGCEPLDVEPTLIWEVKKR